MSDEVWREFRDACGGESVALYLGRLVEREVERHRARRLREGCLDDVELVAALERTQVLRDDLDALVDRLERRIDHRAGSAGGSPPLSGD